MTASSSGEPGGARLCLQDQDRPFELEETSGSPCRIACPADVNVKAYVSLIASRRFDRALEAVKTRNPLPGICGRVCTHPCEAECNRGKVDSPVAIRLLKRFIADYELAPHPVPPAGHVPRERREKVAVVGSGPAGLTVANDLFRLGYHVTVFESRPVPGGMLALAIPEFRLPEQVLKTEIGALQALGIEIRTGCPVADPAALLEQGYSAVFLGVGCHQGYRLGIEGEDTFGMIDAITFLRNVRLGDKTRPGRKVAVIGGGNSAMDSARTAVRLGTDEVRILYRRTEAEMPASAEELEEARHEHVIVDFLVAPVRVVTADGRVAGVECMRMELGAADESGRRRPVPVEGSEHMVECDCVIAAIGQRPDLSFLPQNHGLQVTRWGTLVVDDHCMTGCKGIFAAGDVVTGPETIVGAIAQAHEASAAIHRFIGGEERVLTRPKTEACVKLEGVDVEVRQRIRQNKLSIELRRSTFKEVDHPLTEEEAVAEASRCLRCGPCFECWECTEQCTRRIVGVSLPEGDMLVRSRAWAPGTEGAQPWTGTIERDGLTAQFTAWPVVSSVTPQRCRACGTCVDVCRYRAIAIEHLERKVLADVCRGCGLCVPVCPTNAISLGFFEESKLRDRVEAALKEPGRVLGFVCSSHDVEGLADLGAQTIPVMCVGSITPGLVLHAFQCGARAVFALGCSRGRCRYMAGEDHAARQADKVEEVLRTLGYPPHRFRRGRVSPEDAPGFVRQCLEEADTTGQGG